MYGFDQYGRQIWMTDAKGRGTTNEFDEFGRLRSTRLPLGGTNWVTYDGFGRVSNRFDFKGQMELTRYDYLGRVATNFWFAPGSTYPSNRTEYYYNVLGQLTNVTEFLGTNASGGYVAANGPGGGNRYVAALGRVPREARGGALGLLLAAVGLASLPDRLRRELAQAMARALGEVAQASRLRVELASRRRLRLPSLFWRFATVGTVAALIGCDPAFDRLWTAQAECVYPENSSNETMRVTTYTYDPIGGQLAQVNSPEGVINYEYDLATGRHTRTCTTNTETAYGYDELGRLQTVRKRHARHHADGSGFWERGNVRGGMPLTSTMLLGEVADCPRHSGGFRAPAGWSSEASV